MIVNANSIVYVFEKPSTYICENGKYSKNIADA